jgi:hypothetical protein
MIRSYGPGKFDTIVDSYVYEISLDGTDEELGESGGFGYYCTVKLGEDAVRLIEENYKGDNVLTDEERGLIHNSAGAILEENSQGFVSIKYCDTYTELNALWQDIEKDYDTWLNDEEYE